MYKISTLRLFYSVILLLAMIWIVLSESEILPVHYLHSSATGDYCLSLLSAVTALGGTYCCLRLPALKSSRRQTQLALGQGGGPYAGRWRLVQLVLLAVALWTNAVLYYATPYSPTPKYCLLIAFLTAVFCWPAPNAPLPHDAGSDTPQS